jgi:hypothetical protein
MRQCDSVPIFAVLFEDGANVPGVQEVKLTHAEVDIVFALQDCGTCQQEQRRPSSGSSRQGEEERRTQRKQQIFQRK